ncbi:MAG: hypothetical protein J6I42_01320 [Clostridia bacterium]|nr:hypothetical protein [Oscillospiraceae bacterium]MBO4930795.1 hypothetical protein [Clostridia bacterium]MBO5257517.1 hypothetical protein [Clostridia bacterium]
MLKDFNAPLKTAKMPIRKTLRKLGTIDIGVVETTPVVWNGRLLRFEWVRNSGWGTTARPVGCYRFVDMTDESALPEFADDHSFGCCYAENGAMFVHGTRGGGGGTILDTFVSRDLVNWETSVALEFPDDISLFNTSVCKGPDRYIMAIEIGGSNPAVGKPFTCVFAESFDLVNWTLLPMDEYSYSRDYYSACPVIRYYDGYYYMIYLESAPHHRWLPYIVRTRDLREFELGLTNPIMYPSPEDKTILFPEKFTDDQRAFIENAIDCNNSDVDLCDWDGKTVILYSWGNQYGKEFLALAEYDGSEEEFLKSFFE